MQFGESKRMFFVGAGAATMLAGAFTFFLHKHLNKKELASSLAVAGLILIATPFVLGHQPKIENKK